VSKQTILDAHYAKLKRKIFNYKVETLGQEMEVFKLDSTIRQTRGIEVGSESSFFDGTITVRINWPGEIPIDRVRYSGADDRVENTNPFFFEILPTEIFTKFDDHVKTGDLLVFRFYDEGRNHFHVILKIEETVGSFRQHLVWTKHQCSIFNDQLPQFVMEKLR
jgi:hypothetical protein